MHYDKRVETIRRDVGLCRDSAYLVTGRENILYLSGFSGSAGYLLLTKKKVLLFVDGRYDEIARRDAAVTEVVRFESFLDAIKSYAAGERLSQILFDPGDVTVAFYQSLKERLAGKKLVSSKTPAVARARAVKDSDELDILARAVRKAKAAYRRFMKETTVSGSTERCLAANLKRELEKDSQGVSFAPIVLAGRNASLPHGEPSDKKIKKNTPLLCDFGLKWNNYCTDRTTTEFVRDTELEPYHRVVREAFVQALDAVKCGNEVRSVDDAVRRQFEQAGVLRYFLHSTGQGIGLNVHELPYVGPRSTDVIRSGMVFTIEPGLYIEGVGGVRLEEMVVVTDKGCEVL